jgi:VanZ family protein
MKTRIAGRTPTPLLYSGFSALLVIGFIYSFLAGRAVSDVTDLYQALHLNVLLPLEFVFTGGHIVVYAALTLILCRPRKPVVTWMTIAIWLGILGMGVEFVQEITGHRHYGLGDMVANFVGISLALTYRCLGRRRGRY